MATWTELLDPRDVETDHVFPAETLRELLIDLPWHPNLGRVVCVTITLDTRARVRVGLDSLDPGKRMTSGASGPITPGAGVQRDTVQPWRMTPVLGDAGHLDAGALAQAINTPPAPDGPAAQVLAGARLLDGNGATLHQWPPKVETVTDKPLIILGDK